jgi:hypothetical protein
MVVAFSEYPRLIANKTYTIVVDMLLLYDSSVFLGKYPNRLTGVYPIYREKSTGGTVFILLL